ncbi:MAG: carboxypeptidase regulatory-like domain-containing protein [Vicinamibacteraceae bacterium]
MRRCGWVVALCLVLASRAWAQLASQTALVGTVSDATGSVVPGAVVVAVNVGTQDTYETVTNAQGQYTIQFVRAGTYEITVTLAGFQTVRRSGLEVASNQVVRADAVLQIGDLAETLEVVGATPALDTDRATIAETLNQRLVSEAPLSGRNVWSLAGTTPGVLAGSSSFTGAGQRAPQNSLSLDGINAAANFTTQTSMRPIADAVTEVEVQTGSTSAEYGSYLGVHVNVVTKSGTNDPHGSIFEFFQDDAFDARGYFEDRAEPPNPRRYHQFGVQMDGPVVLPSLYDGRNRTFFMMAYEGIRHDIQETSIESVLTERMRRGDFSGLDGAILNPVSGQPYPGNIVPASDLSPISQRVLEYIPLPNGEGTAANLVATTTETIRTNQVLWRTDQNVGNKVRLYVRYNWRDQVEGGLGVIPANSSDTPQSDHNTLVAYTHTLTPRLVNDFRIGYHTVTESNLGYFLNNNLLDAGSQLGIPGFDADVRYGNPGLPIFSITGFSGVQSGNANWTQGDATFQMSNVLAYTRGTHNIRTGFDLRRLGTERGTFNERRGLFTFNGQITGYAPADFMLGYPQRVTTPADQVINDIRGWRNGFFVNDAWQVSRKVTLNVGLRYELQLVPYTVNGNASMLNEDQTAIIPERPTPGFKFHDPNLLDFAPRVGIAYRATEKTVVRAGFGIYYNPNHFNNFTLLTNNPPFTTQFLFISDPASPTLTLESPMGEAGPASKPNIITPNRHLPSARKDQWSLDLQRQLWADGVLDLQYVGSHTRNLDRSFFNNTPLPGPGAVADRRPNPLFGEIRTFQNDMTADYHAVSVILRQRWSRGFQAAAHYTWSRTRDITDHSNNNAGRSTQDPYNPRADYGPAYWDVPHRFVASYVYELPFFEGSRQRLLRHLFGGWQLSGITTIESGRPFDVRIDQDVANTGHSPQRPDIIGTATDNCGERLVDCIDASAFQMPGPYTYGNTPRNVLRGPGRVTTDLSLVKNVPIGRGARLQLRAEAFNLFNRPNFDNPDAMFDTANFGRITSAQSMRQVQLGAKIIF